MCSERGTEERKARDVRLGRERRREVEEEGKAERPTAGPFDVCNRGFSSQQTYAETQLGRNAPASRDLV